MNAPASVGGRERVRLFCALRLPNGAPIFLGLMVAFIFLQVLLPSLRSQLRLPRAAATTAPPGTEGAAGAATTLLIAGSLLGAISEVSQAAPVDVRTNSTIQSIVQQGRVQDNFVLLSAELKWKTEAGQHLDFLSAPAVLIKIDYPQAAAGRRATFRGPDPRHWR